MGRGRKGPFAEEEHGFTLVELLVVIIIIGILSAIAIPVFLNQRQRAYDGSAKSDLRQLAEFEEAYLIDQNSYSTIAQLRSSGNDVKASPGVTVQVVRFNGALGYCLEAQHFASPTAWYYDSNAGGLQPKGSTGCPVTTTGTPGDALVG